MLPKRYVSCLADHHMAWRGLTAGLVCAVLSMPLSGCNSHGRTRLPCEHGCHPKPDQQRLLPLQVLLLDSDTTRIVSTVYSQSEILEHEVYLVERLDGDQKEQLLHLKVQAAAVSGGSRVH